MQRSKEHSRSKATRGASPATGERLQLHLDRDQAGVADVFGIWNVYLANRSMCVFWARNWYLRVCIWTVCVGEHLHLQLGCNEEGGGNKTRCILLT